MVFLEGIETASNHRDPWVGCLSSLALPDNPREVPDLIVDYNMSKQKYTIVHQEEVMGATSNIQSASFGCLECTGLADINTHQNEEIQKIEGAKSWSNLSKAFACERREVSSHDGTKIPLTILYSRKMQPKGQTPGLLHGYGAYGEVLDKSWHAELVSLLNRGWVIAYADVRQIHAQVGKVMTESCQGLKIPTWLLCEKLSIHIM
ncbi:hypothetical protein ACLOJK_035220 [Asimina triloba]